MISSETGRLADGTLAPRALGEGQRILVVGLLANMLLAAAQLLGGWLGNSRAVLADGLHSSSDILISAMLLISLGVARRPADESHPFGYGKAESIASFVVGLAIAAAGVGLIYDTAASLLAGVKTVPGLLPLGVALFSIAVKGSLYRITMSIGLRLDSPAVITAAREYLSCVACSSAAAVAILGARLGLPVADPIAGLVVAGFVITVAARTLRTSLRDLMDASLPAGEVASIREAAARVDGVRTISALRTRRLGSTRVVDLAIALDPDLLVEEADAVAAQVRSLVAARLDQADRVTVSTAPAERSPRRTAEMEEAIAAIVRTHHGEFRSFQGPRITRLGRDRCAVLTIVTPSSTSMDQAYALSVALEREIRLRYPEVEIIVRFQAPQ